MTRIEPEHIIRAAGALANAEDGRGPVNALGEVAKLALEGQAFADRAGR